MLSRFILRKSFTRITGEDNQTGYEPKITIMPEHFRVTITKIEWLFQRVEKLFRWNLNLNRVWQQNCSTNQVKYFSLYKESNLSRTLTNELLLIYIILIEHHHFVDDIWRDRIIFNWYKELLFSQLTAVHTYAQTRVPPNNLIYKTILCHKRKVWLMIGSICVKNCWNH